MITESVKSQVFTQLGCQSSEAKLLGGYNQHVFEVNRGGEKLVVKIEEGSAASEQDVLSECEWLSYTHEHGLGVIRPLQIAADTYLNRISEGCFFVVYEKVEGAHVSPQDKDVWNHDLFERWGETMGQDAHPRQNVSTCSSAATALTLLDFGDSEYHWFAYDIAIAVYHTAQTVLKGPARKEFVHSFFQSFMEGYSRGNPSTVSLSQIDFFIDYRHLFSYAYHSVHADMSQLTDQQHKYLDDMRLSLQNGESYLGFQLRS
ncbi:phosphotransferase enzyme family protein [Brevibacillus sp. Leaf182]|uniref:phosphotransferase enzyme family protein n=1 Tax=Brevibacillus sp. Leaf182 TaxID=1736290 RepID=UPI0006F4F5A7|nr:phosphotransferase [Brevibacillus sp. Leaf182]RAT98186.1 hypothetical protein ASG16_008470 [Brevibacillus sp. Leaf182]